VLQLAMRMEMSRNALGNLRLVSIRLTVKQIGGISLELLGERV
jgi:hypothetical protein